MTTDSWIAAAAAQGVAARPLVLKFGGSLVEQLGAQLYPSVTATVAELISNAWDADAANVWVEVPFDDDWRRPGAEITVLDDGHGMTRDEAQDAYLVVGRRKRMFGRGDLSEGGRLVHGRKGIGKLAAFGTAGYLECVTSRQGEVTAFGIDYDEVRRLNPDQNYFVDPVKNPPPLMRPDGLALAHGTRVTLSKLRVKRKISAESFQLSMSRRFALREMRVFINGTPLTRFQIPLQFRLPADANRPGTSIDEDGWGVETLPSGDEVRWWIGFTEKPLAEGEQQGVSILARDKMAQRPFKFERSQGTTNQLGMEYLVGEVTADWLDQGDDIDTDYIQSNRDQLQLENARLDEFMAWGRALLVWALRARGELRDRLAAEATQKDVELNEIIGEGTAREKRLLRDIAGRLSRLPEVQEDQVRSLMRSVVESRSESQIRAIAAEIESSDSPDEETVWRLVEQAGALDARRLVEVIDARIATLDRLGASLGSAELKEITSRVLQDTWLFDPRWHLLGRAVELDRVSESAAEGSLRGLIAIRPALPAPVDEIVLIQIEDAEVTDGVNLDRLRTRLRGVSARYPAARVQALLVAPSFAPDTRDLYRLDPAMQIKTWAEALADSKARHLAWLALSKKRGTDKS